MRDDRQIDPVQPDPECAIPLVRFVAIAAACFGVIAILLMRDLLIRGDWVISAPTRDIDRYFFAVREFCFAQQIRSGHFPLWNPFVFGGLPALGNFQYALLYPLNFPHLIFSTGLAINLVVAIHLVVAGTSASLWCRWRGAGAVPALVGGLLFMLGGPYAIRIYSGHLTYLCVVAWTPLLFLCSDAIIERRRTGLAVLLGGGAVAMQALAGYPQPAYFALLGLIVYSSVRLIHHPRAFRAAGCILLMYVVGAILPAAQILPGLEATFESVRSEPTLPSFATTFSLPPENLLTLVAPRVFGDDIKAIAFSRWSMTETSLFIGSIGLILAMIGICTCRRRRDLALVICATAALVLALGRYTPLYRIFFTIVPELSHFRAPVRFSFLISLCLSVLAANGLDRVRLLKSRQLLIIALLAGAVAAIFAAAGAAVYQSASTGPAGLWGRVIRSLVATGETFADPSALSSSPQIERSARLAASQIWIAAAFFAAAGVGLFCCVRSPKAFYGLAALVLVEMLIGSAPGFQRFRPTTSPPPQWREPIEEARSRGDRILIAEGLDQNLPILLNVASIAGYDPFVPRRWADLLAPLVGADPQYGEFWVHRLVRSPCWSLMRALTALPPAEQIADRPMPRLSLIGNFIVVGSAEQSLSLMRSGRIDPRQVVLLEDQPTPLPVLTGAAAGQVQLLHESCDSIEISADLPQPAILLITDGYSSGWRVRPLTHDRQDSYEVLPADHIMRAIPLSAGQHHFVLEYRPVSLTAGIAISIVGLIGYAVAWLIVLRQDRSSPSPRIT